MDYVKIRIALKTDGTEEITPTLPDYYSRSKKCPPLIFHNESESSILMTDWKIVDGITLNDGTAFDNVLMTTNALVNTKGSWNNTTEDLGIVWDGASKWQVITGGSTVLYEVVNSDSFPPRSGWTVENGTGTLVLTYNDFYVDSSTNEFRRVSFANIVTQHDESNGSTGNWVKLNADDLATEGVTYTRDNHQNQTAEELLIKERYFSGTSAALRDVDSVLLLDADGLPQISATEIS